MPTDASRYLTYLGKRVHVVMDRPMGSVHPRLGFQYPVNYGYLPGTLAGDGAEIDACVLEVAGPLAQYDGLCVGLVLRHDDLEHKLVVAPRPMAAADIERQVAFVEDHYRTEVVVHQPDR